ncbi:hypothetical protein [Streptomyces sp. NPDC048606]|uniref:hypothetical protein n=1 Tax=Streptomyces sp. NPDC048606 TaxID=3154726 RepID=UPI00341ADCF3
MTMVCAPVFGILIALALDRIIGFRACEHRVVGCLAVAAALVPILSLPLVTEEREGTQDGRRPPDPADRPLLTR